MIKIQDLSFSYKENPLFHDFFLTLTSRRFSAIIGPNGSGKTTLLKLLLGIYKPLDGSLFIEDKNLTELNHRERAALISYVPQSMENTYDFSLEETVLMGRYPHRQEWQKESKEDRKIVQRAMDIMEITHLKNRSIHTVSGGERQRALIARALAQKTPLMLLDEPTAFLDLRHQLSIMKLIKRITIKENITVIAVIHDLNLALNYADQAILLDRGKLIARGNPNEVLTSENIKKVYGVNTEMIHHKNKSILIPE